MEHSAQWFLDAIQSDSMEKLDSFFLKSVHESYPNITWRVPTRDMLGELTIHSVAFRVHAIEFDTNIPPLSIQHDCKCLKLALLAQCYSLVHELPLPETDAIKEHIKVLEDFEASGAFKSTSFLCDIDCSCKKKYGGIHIQLYWRMNLYSVFQLSTKIDAQRLDIHIANKFITELTSENMKCKAAVIHLHWIKQKEALSNEKVNASSYDVQELFESLLPKLYSLQCVELHLTQPRIVTTDPNRFAVWYGCEIPKNVCIAVTETFKIKI